MSECNEPLKGSAAESFTAFCDEKLRVLPRISRMELLGVDGKCLYRFDTSNPGIILGDGQGGFIYTDSPNLDLPQLVNYLNGQSQFVLDGNGNQIEQVPPGADFLMVQMEDGRWLKLRGEPGVAAFAYWDGTEFLLRDFTQVPLESALYEQVEEVLLVGIEPLETCEDEANPPVRAIREWKPGVEGAVFFKRDPISGQIRSTVIDLCSIWEEDLTKSATFPFIPVCVGGNPVKFKGGETGAMVVWDKTAQQWKKIEVSATACDPSCSCADYLTLVYDCPTGVFSLSAPPTHVLMAKDADAAGVSARVTFTLPWPALVAIHAGRRLVPTAGSMDVVSADIVVDACVVTSPDDGGLVASLQEASLQGMALLYLEKGTHTVYTSNQQTTSVDPIQWSGSWIKLWAHKIAECNPNNGLVVPGDIRAAYGASGGICDCPPGAAGPQGEQGVQGVPGEPGGLDWDPPIGTEPIYGIWCYTSGSGYQPYPSPTFNAADPIHADGKQYFAWCVDSLGNSSWSNISGAISGGSDVPTEPSTT